MARIDIEPTGRLSEGMIETLVRTFYGHIQTHDTLGPVFEHEIAGDWEPHLQKMIAFWSSAMLKTGAYDGRPMVVHKRLSDKATLPLREDHFEEWLALFKATVFELFEDDIAEQFMEKAGRIADSLRLGIFYRI
ncbi:group III truncated hemoglobin [Kordiimonas sp. SCSIO 12610]|uniref:group III truncated hemoglobin n=1 Tax=Kordiimonas sp. SCSIO 12610 TaxID=2829597 RepID=UPI00210A0A75|nr:group III truncated hemoglobin [Kordiimonas sp. SCSIO 12610]UTW56286.1 group III truncated hemoglobin [Kordiimonas sp. SCSIO 12610]